MFWGSSDLDLKVMMIGLVFALIISIFVYLKFKKMLLSLFVFSFLGNLTFFLMTSANSMMFRFYKTEWLKMFSLRIWPWINLALLILLIINFIRNKYAKKIN